MEAMKTTHPLALMFPVMGEAEFADLKADIGRQGLTNPIILYEGQILDGQHRYRACVELARAGVAVEPVFKDFSECGVEDPLLFVVSQNIKRRHLTQGQLAMIGVKMVTTSRGRPKKDPVTRSFSIEDAAALVGVGVGTLRKALAVLKFDSVLGSIVRDGSLTLDKAVQEMNARKRQEKECQEEAERRKSVQAAKEKRAREAAEQARQHEAAEKERAEAARQRAERARGQREQAQAEAVERQRERAEQEAEAARQRAEDAERRRKAAEAKAAEAKAAEEAKAKEEEAAADVEAVKGRLAEDVLEARRMVREGYTHTKPDGTTEVKYPKSVGAALSVLDRMRLQGEEERPLPEGQFNAVVIDPPWDMPNIETENRPNQHIGGRQYPVMSVQAIKDFWVPDVLAEDCFVFLWTTQRYLPDSLDILRAWGLKYRCVMVWDKGSGSHPTVVPQYNNEFVVVGAKGSPEFRAIDGFVTCFQAPRGGHSVKPDAFYETIRRVTQGPRLDVFNKREIEGFEGWGNESPAAAA